MRGGDGDRDGGDEPSDALFAWGCGKGAGVCQYIIAIEVLRQSREAQTIGHCDFSRTIDFVDSGQDIVEDASSLLGEGGVEKERHNAD